MHKHSVDKKRKFFAKSGFAFWKPVTSHVTVMSLQQQTALCHTCNFIAGGWALVGLVGL
eukprot:COSAG04_NODE_659_length_11458_cov_3.404173_5_plen_59_part_00